MTVCIFHTLLSLMPTAKARNVGTLRWFTIVPPFLFVPSFVFDAPFGRFALATKSIFELDGT